MEPTVSVLSSTAAKISANANTLEAYFRTENLLGPGFGCLVEYDTILKDPAVARARKDLINDVKKLLLHALSPLESFHLGIMSVRCDFALLRYRVNDSTANPTAWWTACALPFQGSSNSALGRRDQP
jgi:hypothetical protein